MTTLLLTNRLQKIIDKIENGALLTVVSIPFVLMGSLFFNFKSCENTSKDIPDVAYKARALGGFNDSTNVFAHAPMGTAPYLTDTTKPKQKVILNHYKLEGSDTLFQMLWLQVQSPIDVTPRNLQLLKNWLQSSIKIDSTNGK